MPRCTVDGQEDLEAKREGWFCEERGAILVAHDTVPAPRRAVVSEMPARFPVPEADGVAGEVLHDRPAVDAAPPSVRSGIDSDAAVHGSQTQVLGTCAAAAGSPPSGPVGRARVVRQDDDRGEDAWGEGLAGAWQGGRRSSALPGRSVVVAAMDGLTTCARRVGWTWATSSR